MMKDLTHLSKSLAYYLRHNPQELGITLDSEGWSDLDVFIEKLRAAGYPVNLDTILKIVKEDKKGRYSIKKTIDTNTGAPKSLIRANQGHSVMEISFEKAIPPEVLYHGTTVERWHKIMKSGALLPMSRHHVHLTADKNLAVSGAQRWKNETPILLAVDALKMHGEDYLFYCSENNVWLSKLVPVSYIRIMDI